MHVVDGIEIFDTIGDDEQLFADWLRANPKGYVANIGRGANKYSHVKLHQATCEFMISERVAKNGFVGTDFYKACSLDGQALIKWTQNGYQLRQWENLRMIGGFVTQHFSLNKYGAKTRSCSV